MYTRTASLTILYIRNVMPDDTVIPSPATLADWGGAMAYSSNVMECKFSEVHLQDRA
jgi:hypothetical protein